MPVPVTVRDSRIIFAKKHPPAGTDPQKTRYRIALNDQNSLLKNISDKKSSPMEVQWVKMTSKSLTGSKFWFKKSCKIFKKKFSTSFFAISYFKIEFQTSKTIYADVPILTGETEFPEYTLTMLCYRDP